MAEPVAELGKGWTDITSAVCLNVRSKDEILGLDHDSKGTGQSC